MTVSTEDVINGLSLFSELAVIASNSSFAVPRTRPSDVRAIGTPLGVLYVVEGTVRRFNDRIRITPQLVDAQSGVRRWSERFDAALGDVFTVQDEITRAIVSLVVGLTWARRKSSASRRNSRTHGRPTIS